MARAGSRSANGRSPAAARGAGSGRTGSGRAARRLARLGATRGGGINPVLEPLIKTVRATHPKADVRLIERAYDVAAHWHSGQKRKSGDPYITHPLAVATILAELGMNTETLVRGAAARHGRGHRLHPRRAARRLRRRDRRAGRRRDQARQGQVRRRRRGRDRPQDGRRDVPRHPRAGHQARRPAAQHAHAALPAAREAGAQVARGAGDLRPAGPPARHEHDQVGARGPRVRDAVPEALRRDRPAGLRARPAPRRLPAGGHRGRLLRPARRPRSRRGSPAAPSTTTRSTRR